MWCLVGKINIYNVQFLAPKTLSPALLCSFFPLHSSAKDIHDILTKCTMALNMCFPSFHCHNSHHTLTNSLDDSITNKLSAFSIAKLFFHTSYTPMNMALSSGEFPLGSHICIMPHYDLHSTLHTNNLYPIKYSAILFDQLPYNFYPYHIHFLNT